VIGNNIMISLTKEIKQLTIEKDVKDERGGKKERKLIGFLHDEQLTLYGGFIYKDMNGKNVVVTEVIYEDEVNKITMNYDGTKYVGYLKVFVKHLCPTRLEKVPNCVCKQMLGLFISNVGYNKMAIKPDEKLENISEPYAWKSYICG
jgi:hypothetical protein